MFEKHNGQGFFSSLRRLLATALEIAQVRLELISSEIEHEKRRVFDGLLWGAFALLMLGMGLVFLCSFVILMFWDGYRLAAVGVLAVIFIAAGAILVRQARMNLCQPKGIFAATIEELKRDRNALDATDHHE